MGENNTYLIPANSKKSMLILGFFNPTDLFIFGGGCIVTVTLMLTMNTQVIKNIPFILAPALICGFLVVPLPNQHNVRTFIKNVYEYFTNRRRYFWKGWCNSYGQENRNK
jgi:hypothetical protein